MIKRLADNIIYVRGPKNSAIYDFNAKKVYTINDFGTNILTKYLKEERLEEDSEKKFVEQIKGMFKIQELQNEDYLFNKIPKKLLQFVWLEVTNACPCRCIHCYEGKEHKECDNPLQFDEWLRIIDEIAELKCKEIRFIGGEPTIYKRLNELIEYSKQKGIEKVSVFSNLYCIDKPELLESIAKNNVEIHFSLYAANAKIHDSITQVHGSFNKLVENIKKLKELSVKLVAHVVIIKENENEVDKIYGLLSSLEIDTIKYDEFRKVYGVCDNKHAVSKSRLTNKKQNFKTTKEQFELSNFVNTCWFGKCVISSNGDVFPCEIERNHIYGNVRNKLLKDIIRSNVVDRFWFWNFGKVETCKDCELRFACRDCRPLAYAENGNMSEKNPRCGYNPESGTWN